MPPPPGSLPPSPAEWAPPPPLPSADRYASFWIRVAATLIDALVLLPLSIPFLIASWSTISDQLNGSSSAGDAFRSGAALGHVAAWALTVATVNYGYQALMIRYFGGTLGKLAVGIRVRRDDGTFVGWREALLRPILQLALAYGSFIPGAGLTSILDDLWMIWDRQSQTLHDKIASTIVVYV